MPITAAASKAVNNYGGAYGPSRMKLGELRLPFLSDLNFKMNA